MKFKIPFGLILLATLLWSCARPYLPTGGTKDETPPVLDTLKSTPLYQTNFDKSEIILVFDEWLKAGNQTQVFVSPPLNYPPRINTRGKTVTYSFNEKEQLKENTTYVINFGEYIQDLNEGNSIKNMAYVFSTGSYLDSLSLSAQIVNNETSTAKKDPMVLLVYNNPRDSNIVDELPLYAAYADESGKAKINYMAPGNYYVYGLLDKNANLKFDGGDEKAGFYLDSISVRGEAIQVKIELSKEDPLITKPIVSRSKGVVTLKYNQNPGDLIFFDVPDSVRFGYLQTGETVEIFHFAEEEIKWELKVKNSFEQIDTISVSSKTDTVEIKKVIKRKENIPNLDIRLERLTFLQPLRNFNTDHINVLLKSDTLFEKQNQSLRLHKLDEAGFYADVFFPWIKDSTYKIEFLPGALENLWSEKNKDTLEVIFKKNDPTSYGTITFNFSSIDSNETYIVDIISQKESIWTEFMTGKTTHSFELNRLVPGKYQLRIIEDKNKNGRADLGKVLTKTPAERVITRDLDELRADWDLELEMEVSKAFEK